MFRFAAALSFVSLLSACVGQGGGTASFASAKTPTASGPLPVSALPYGEMAKVCGVSKAEMGKQVAQHPEKGPKYRIFDSNPAASGPRAFFMTRFKDGCARQFTASLAIFGSVEMHEQLRYGLPAEVQPFSDTDKAYEQVKSKACRVGKGKPCGAKQKKLEKDTVFVSVYERLSGNAQWVNVLLHGGEVAAVDKVGG